MSNRRSRPRKPSRRAPFRPPRPVLLIVCEGEKTEPQYLFGLQRAVRNPRVDIEIAPHHGVPKTLVEIAKRLKEQALAAAKRERDENLEYDSVWCVFDIDDHPHVAEARQMARDNAIELAVSHPCFELWLLLHLRESPGMQHRDKVQQMLKDLVPEYDKHVDFAIYVDGYHAAVTRARRLYQAAETDREPGRNPTTNVCELTELIRGDAELG